MARASASYARARTVARVIPVGPLTATTPIVEPAQVTLKAVTTEPVGPDYGAMTKPELIAAAEKLGLDSSGNKPDILARIEGRS